MVSFPYRHAKFCADFASGCVDCKAPGPKNLALFLLQEMRYAWRYHGHVRDGLTSASSYYLMMIFQPCKVDAELQYVHIISLFFSLFASLIV